MSYHLRIHPDEEMVQVKSGTYEQEEEYGSPYREVTGDSLHHSKEDRSPTSLSGAVNCIESQDP